jgi:hypothetical protein
MGGNGLDIGHNFRRLFKDIAVNSLQDVPQPTSIRLPVGHHVRIVNVPAVADLRFQKVTGKLKQPCNTLQFLHRASLLTKYVPIYLCPSSEPVSTAAAAWLTPASTAAGADPGRTT